MEATPSFPNPVPTSAIPNYTDPASPQVLNRLMPSRDRQIVNLKTSSVLSLIAQDEDDDQLIHYHFDADHDDDGNPRCTFRLSLLASQAAELGLPRFDEEFFPTENQYETTVSVTI